MFTRLLHSVSRLTLILALVAVSSVSLLAQTGAGSIAGVVQDAQGAVVPNAKVTLESPALGAAATRTLNSGADGGFTFTPVLPGTYTVTVELQGFKKYIQSNITLDVNDKLGLPAIALEVGSTGESITVEANAVQLQTLSAERSGVVTGAQVVEILHRIDLAGFMLLIRPVLLKCRLQFQERQRCKRRPRAQRVIKIDVDQHTAQIEQQGLDGRSWHGQIRKHGARDRAKSPAMPPSRS